MKSLNLWLGNTSLFVPFLNSCGDLQHFTLQLDRPSPEEADIIACLVKRSPNLQTLHVAGTGCDDRVLLAAAETCSNLQSLRISWSSDCGVAAVARACTNLTRLQLDVNCELQDSRDPFTLIRNSVSVTDSSLAELALHCTALVDLSLAGRRKLSDDGIGRVVTHNTNLQHLVLNGCVNVGSMGTSAVPFIR